jgi:ubiquinone/menaquinone biosynthesis C-methylase UbiE
MAFGLLARDGGWRTAFVDQIAPRAQDIILDIGCGDGALTVMLAQAAPKARIIGVDPDPAALARARARAAASGVSVSFIHGLGRDIERVLADATATKIVSSLVLHKLSSAGKREMLTTMRAALSPGAQLHVADYGAQRSALMERLFRSVRALEGFENTEANARGALPGLIRAAGFEAVEETGSAPTAMGSISFYRARAAAAAPQRLGA